MGRAGKQTCDLSGGNPTYNKGYRIKEEQTSNSPNNQGSCRYFSQAETGGSPAITPHVTLGTHRFRASATVMLTWTWNYIHTTQQVRPGHMLLGPSL